MLRKLYSFIKRPTLGSTDTSNLVYARPFSSPVSDINGSGGHAYLRSMAATYPMGLAPGPTLKLANPAVTGVLNKTLNQQPLTDEKLKAI